MKILGGFLCLLLLPGWALAQVAFQRSITTAMGQGADAAIRRDQPHNNFGSEAALVIRSAPAFPNPDIGSAKTFLRFDRAFILRPTDEIAAARLTIRLAAATSGAAVIRVYGLGEDYIQSGGPLVEGWEESRITWATAPALDRLNTDGDVLIEGNDPGRAAYLGSIQIPGTAGTGEEFALEGGAGSPLVDFLRRDLNERFTFILQEESKSGVEVRVVSKEGAAGHPRLDLTALRSVGGAEFIFIHSITRAEPGAVELVWSSVPDYHYWLEYTDDLNQEIWQRFPGPSIPAGPFSTTRFTDTSASASPRRFYRVQLAFEDPPRTDPPREQVLIESLLSYNQKIEAVRKHVETEYEDFDEPAKAVANILASPGNPDVLVEGVIDIGESAVDFGQDAGTKGPLIDPIADRIDPTWIYLEAFYYASIAPVIGGGQPNVNDATAALASLGPAAVANAQEILSPALELATGPVTATANFFTGHINAIASNPGPNPILNFLSEIPFETPLQAPWIERADTGGGEGYEDIFGELEDFYEEMSASPSPGVAQAYALYYLEAAPQVPQAWIYGASSIAALEAAYALDQVYRLFTMPVLENLNPLKPALDALVRP